MKFGAVMTRKVRLPSLAACLLAVLPPLLLCLFWHSLNQFCFNLDAPYYISDMVPAVQKLRHSGWLSLYWARCLKTVLPPSFLVPFLLFTNDVRISVAGFNLLVYGVFLIYLARFSRRFLSDIGAACATWFIGTLPWLMLSVEHFNCELPYLAAGMVAVFYLSEDELFTSTRRSVFLGLALAMAFCAQPFGALINIGVVYVYFVFRAYRAGGLSKADIATAFAMAGFVVAAPWLYHSPPGEHRRVLWGLFFAWLAIVGATQVLRAKGRLNKNFLLVQTISLSLFLFWFAPYYRRLYDWAFYSTYGDLVTIGMGLPVLRELCLTIGGWFFMSFLSLGMLAGIFRWKSQDPLPPRLRQLSAMTVVSLVSVPIAALTRNPDIRYHYLGLIVLCVLVIALVAGDQRLRFALLLIGFGHGCWVINSFTENSWRKPWVNFYCAADEYSWRYTDILSPQPKDYFLPVLLRRMSADIDLKHDIRIVAMMDNVLGPSRLVGLVIISHYMGNSARFELPYEVLHEPWRDVDFDWSRVKAKYMLVAVPRSGEQKLADIDYGAMGKKIVGLWKANQLERHGLTLMKTIPLREKDADLLILKIGSDRT